MAGLVQEVGTYLASQLSLTRGTNLFEGIMPETPNACLAVLTYAGGPSELGFGVTTGVQYEQPGLAIWCRGEPNDYTTPRDQAHSARQALAKVQATSLSGTLYHYIIPLQSPFVLETDENERRVLAFNCRVKKEPS